MKVKLCGEFVIIKGSEKAEVLRCEEVWCHQVACNGNSLLECGSCELLDACVLSLDELEVIYDEED